MSDTTIGAHIPDACAPPSWITEADLGDCIGPHSSLWKRIAGSAARRLRDPLEGEDIAQETALRVLAAIGKGKHINHLALPRYCYRTAAPLVRERRQELRRFATMDSVAPTDDLGDDPERRAKRLVREDLLGVRFPDAENCAFMRELVDLLPPRDRRLMELTVFGYEEAEIAAVLGISSGNNVRQIRHRVRRFIVKATEGCGVRRLS